MPGICLAPLGPLSPILMKPIPNVADVATLAFTWNKPLATRLLPAPGKTVGEMTELAVLLQMRSFSR
jgi:hypothetical protein